MAEKVKQNNRTNRRRRVKNRTVQFQSKTPSNPDQSLRVGKDSTRQRKNMNSHSRREGDGDHVLLQNTDVRDDMKNESKKCTRRMNNNFQEKQCNAASERGEKNETAKRSNTRKKQHRARGCRGRGSRRNRSMQRAAERAANIVLSDNVRNFSEDDRDEIVSYTLLRKDFNGRTRLGNGGQSEVDAYDIQPLTSYEEVNYSGDFKPGSTDENPPLPISPHRTVEDKGGMKGLPYWSNASKHPCSTESREKYPKKFERCVPPDGDTTETSFETGADAQRSRQQFKSEGKPPPRRRVLEDTIILPSPSSSSFSDVTNGKENGCISLPWQICSRLLEHSELKLQEDMKNMCRANTTNNYDVAPVQSKAKGTVLCHEQSTLFHSSLPHTFLDGNREGCRHSGMFCSLSMAPDNLENPKKLNTNLYIPSAPFITDTANNSSMLKKHLSASPKEGTNLRFSSCRKQNGKQEVYEKSRDIVASDHMAAGLLPEKCKSNIFQTNGSKRNYRASVTSQADEEHSLPILPPMTANMISEKKLKGGVKQEQMTKSFSAVLECVQDRYVAHRFGAATETQGYRVNGKHCRENYHHRTNSGGNERVRKQRDNTELSLFQISPRSFLLGRRKKRRTMEGTEFNDILSLLDQQGVMDPCEFGAEVDRCHFWF